MPFRKEMIFDDWLCDIHTRNIPIGGAFDVLHLNDIGSYVFLMLFLCLYVFHVFHVFHVPSKCLLSHCMHCTALYCVAAVIITSFVCKCFRNRMYFYFNCRSVGVADDLLADEFSQQNRMILSKTLRTPICIDPQFKAIECIKAAHQCQNNVKFLQFDADNTIGELLKAIALGEIVVFEDVRAHIDPTLMDLLEIKLLSWFPSFSSIASFLFAVSFLLFFFFFVCPPFFKMNFAFFFFFFSFFFISCPEKDNRHFVRIGSIEIEYNDDFRMYLVSHRSNPKFSAHVYSSAVVINFNTTLASLENQLLDIVFASLDVDMAHERASLHGSVVANHKRLDELEEGLLTQIASCDGNLLDNPNTMKLLECTKHEVQQLNATIFANKNTLTHIEMKRNDFRLIALKAASLYIVLADLAALNPFYQHAMCDFISIFTQIMETTQSQGGASSSSDTVHHSDVNQRLLKIIADLSKRIYNIGSMGIFQKDKLLFALRIATELEHSDGRLSRSEIDFLLRPIALTRTPNTTIDWLSAQQHSAIEQLMIALPTEFNGFSKEIEMNAKQWLCWLRTENPESINCPEPYAVCITQFQVAF